LREADYLCEYNIAQNTPALHWKLSPTSHYGDIYMATTGHYRGFIPTLDYPEMVRVNSEVAHETMPGLNFMQGSAQVGNRAAVPHRPERPDAGKIWMVTDLILRRP
jgi:hypothetical protein